MTESAFGVDFGTTNSLVVRIVGGKAVSLVDTSTLRPHPSVIWYRGSEVVVGSEARQHLDHTESGAPPGFVRSPKMALRREGPIFVDGRSVDPTDAVAEVLRYLQQDATKSRERASGVKLDRAVMTVPVDFGGPERRALRKAARKAGIGVVQFVHEPVAALYAYLRSLPDHQRELGRFDGRTVLVFDWGGGTLDLTLCRIQGGTIYQIDNQGENEVGGDHFDERLRNLVRSKHAATHQLEDTTAVEHPGMAAKLLHRCEQVKIDLSSPSRSIGDVIIRDFIRSDGPGRDLRVSVSKVELEAVSASIVSKGLSQIDRVLERAGLTYQDIELCLATGGMVNMPAIRSGLTERFLGRVPKLENGDRIIAEGAAWIAHDGLQLKLAKPIEILIADGSGRGAYYPLVNAGLTLPTENQTVGAANTRLFCVDPRDGFATVEFAKPIRSGLATPSDPRKSLCVASVSVDPSAEPLVERLDCQLNIDHDYVANVILRSTGQDGETEVEFHDLDFALQLPYGPSFAASSGSQEQSERGQSTARSTKRGAIAINVIQRANVVVAAEGQHTSGELWQMIPGDIVDRWRPAFFDNRSQRATAQQNAERNFYRPCGRCGRLISKLNAEGPVDACRGRPCASLLPRQPFVEPGASASFEQP